MSGTFLRCLVLLIALWPVLGLGQEPVFEDTMAERTRACSHCHGKQGRAGPDGYYPRLAGKPAAYPCKYSACLASTAPAAIPY